MSVNFGYSSMMPGMGMGMMGMMGMPGMGMGMNTAGSSGNVMQGLRAKHGCEDCFRKEPYWVEYPKPVSPLPKDAIEPSFWLRMKRIFLGG